MVLEIASYQIRPGEETAFAAAYRKARPILTGTPGCRSVRLTQGIESPSRFVLLVEWDHVESADRGFRRTDRLVRWRALLEPFYAEPPMIDYAVDVPSAEGRS
jgi:heme-degrading monooxygenase HmoA